MRYLLITRVITLALIYLGISRLLPDLTAPLSIFASILHELGHAVGGSISGGSVLGFTLASDCPCLYACVSGGSATLTLLGGNLFSIGAAWLFVFWGRTVSKVSAFIAPVFSILILLMLLTVRLIADPDILSLWLVLIYALLFLFFILTQTVWGGSFLIFFGLYNLTVIFRDLLEGSILSDAVRYAKLFPAVPLMFWVALWFGITGYVAYQLINQVAKTKVEWAKGRSFFKNLDVDKIVLFLSILFPMIAYFFDQLLEFLVIQVTRIFDYFKRLIAS
jgi:hypothetical protein